jgi:hypothetical protein
MKENLGLALYAFLFMVLPFLLTFCVSETDQRQRWQDCGDVYHEECWPIGGSSVDARMCEYRYYKGCVK